MASTRFIPAALVAAAIMFAPAPARADGFFIPFFGVNFGGDSGKEFSQAFDTKQFNWGASLGWMGGGVFGFEADFGVSPDFYGETATGGSSLYTATGNLILGMPLGGQKGFGVRPSGVIGAGMLGVGTALGSRGSDLV